MLRVKIGSSLVLALALCASLGMGSALARRRLPAARRPLAAPAPAAPAGTERHEGEGRKRARAARRSIASPRRSGLRARSRSPRRFSSSEVDHQLRLAGVEAGLHPQDSRQRFPRTVLISARVRRSNPRI